MTLFRRLSAAALIVLTTACASTRQVDTAASGAAEDAKEACGSFFVYEMCMMDIEADRRVDYMYFADDDTIFMYQQGSALPADKPLHECAMPMSEDVLAHSSQLLYGEELNLLQEMDVKRKLLLSYMAAKDGVEDCYGADPSTGNVESTASAGGDFASDDFDWGEE